MHERVANAKICGADDCVDVVIASGLVAEVPNKLVETVARLADPGGSVVVADEEAFVWCALVVGIGR